MISGLNNGSAHVSGGLQAWRAVEWKQMASRGRAKIVGGTYVMAQKTL